MTDFVAEVMRSWAEVRPGLDMSPIAVVSRILRAGQLIQQRLDAVLAADGDLSHKGDLDTLTALRRSGRGNGLSPSALARVGQLTSGGTTNRLDRLEAAGLISRAPDPTDRRSVLVSLTPEGEHVADEAFAAGLVYQESLLAALSEQERSQLATLLEELLTSLGDLPLG